ncbi:hypothetical protein T440DRAFT_214172 [Plenodomus tracheiphilus IPT5]|uniref:Uncharacterized protein n=1 Tax=Plenodomus tracheiphilus IPT5 TaxID=1408161 RepID=A0A6A7AV42_9PLEO|nr:hypothetical protein T440DRAFT_214172 [Plenodomus tracheiphilus IPT5]
MIQTDLEANPRTRTSCARRRYTNKNSHPCNALKTIPKALFNLVHCQSTPMLSYKCAHTYTIKAKRTIPPPPPPKSQNPNATLYPAQTSAINTGDPHPSRSRSRALLVESNKLLYIAPYMLYLGVCPTLQRYCMPACCPFKKNKKERKAPRGANFCYFWLFWHCIIGYW